MSYINFASKVSTNYSVFRALEFQSVMSEPEIVFLIFGFNVQRIIQKQNFKGIIINVTGTVSYTSIKVLQR